MTDALLEKIKVSIYLYSLLLINFVELLPIVLMASCCVTYYFKYTGIPPTPALIHHIVSAGQFPSLFQGQGAARGTFATTLCFEGWVIF